MWYHLTHKLLLTLYRRLGKTCLLPLLCVVNGHMLYSWLGINGYLYFVVLADKYVYFYMHSMIKRGLLYAKYFGCSYVEQCNVRSEVTVDNRT